MGQQTSTQDQSLGDRLAYIRAHRSQKDWAEKLGVPLRTYQTYERGQREPDGRTLQGCAEEGWNLHWVLTGQGPERTTDSHDPELLAKRNAALLGDAEAREWLRIFEKGFFASMRAARESSQDLSHEHLSVAIELADEVLTGLWLPKNRYAELVALIYDALMQGLPYAEILEFSRPAARRLSGQKQKEHDDDGGEGQDQPDQKAG